MSTTSPDWVSEATSLLSAASGPSGAVTAVSNFLTKVLDIAEPLITDDETQRYENERKARVTEATELLSELVANPGADTAQRYNDFDDKLQLDAGSALVGGVAGPTVTIGVDRLLAKDALIAELIADRAYQTSLIQNAVKGTPVTGAAK